jgi:hypothetical protein
MAGRDRVSVLKQPDLPDCLWLHWISMAETCAAGLASSRSSEVDRLGSHGWSAPTTGGPICAARAGPGSAAAAALPRHTARTLVRRRRSGTSPPTIARSSMPGGYTLGARTTAVPPSGPRTPALRRTRRVDTAHTVPRTVRPLSARKRRTPTDRARPPSCHSAPHDRRGRRVRPKASTSVRALYGPVCISGNPALTRWPFPASNGPRDR